MAFAANGGGAKMTEALAPVSAFASATVLNTGRPRCVFPPLPGVTPPTICVPYAMDCSLWNVPCFPVNPWHISLVFLSQNTGAPGVPVPDAKVRAEERAAGRASLLMTDLITGTPM